MLAIITKIFLIALLYISFSIQGLFEEKLYGKIYSLPDSTGTFKFQEANLNYFSVSVLSVILSGFIIMKNRTKTTLYSGKDKIIMGGLYTIGKMANEHSMRYLDFISKTIAKSIKSLSSK